MQHPIDEPARNVMPALTVGQGRCERMVIRTGDGRVFDLGSPASFLFPLRRWIYLWRRRKEFSNG